MSLASLRSRILGELHHRPQAAMEATHGFRELESGLAALARLGYLFHLEPGPQPPGVEWPRLMFHVSSAPNGRLVASSWDLAELGPDWFPTLEEAQHAEGLRAQFAGRGGLGQRGLPVALGAPESISFLADERQRRDQMILDWKTTKAKESAP